MDEPTVRVELHESEWYPVITVDEDAQLDSCSCDIPISLLERYHAADKFFDAVQAELRPYLEKRFDKSQRYPALDDNDEAINYDAISRLFVRDNEGQIGRKAILRWSGVEGDGKEVEVKDVSYDRYLIEPTGYWVREHQLEWIDD